jgi:malonate decarboxylase delta subunit
MERMSMRYAGRVPLAGFRSAQVGVVGSGNLEVLVEPAEGMQCAVRVCTSARGFAAIWEAVLGDFHLRHPYGGLAIAINDMGATPAVVSLRLDQAIAEVLAGGQP